eukprot:COSAG05_NODE_474_length_9484_cov_8.277784_1_plen_612_part_00
MVPSHDRSRRGSSIQDDDIAQAGGPERKPAKKKRVDTSALTGLRGLAALQVAAGHIAPLTNLWGGGVDLIGSAAMPFFFLLSGFIMTLGYGQTTYSVPGCCCCRQRKSDVEEQDGAAGATKPMAKGRFWQNRFARLWPVYMVTNVWVVPRIFQMHSMGGGAGVLGITVNLILAALGMNSWVVPLIDAGMPPNGVCWTITTMSFFYWCFPFLLPRWQRMPVESRNAWIVNCFWIQCLGYLLPFWLYARIPQGVFYRPGAGGRPDGAWWSGVAYEVRNQGSWIGRAWPGTRIFVFAMGCLSALNRLDANHNGDDQAAAISSTTTAQKEAEGEEEGRNPAAAITAARSKAAEDNKGQVVVAGRGGFDLDCSCRLGPRSRDSPQAWARRADTLVLIYILFIALQVLIANLHNPMHVVLMEAGLTYYGMPIQGRAVAEALIPMLELGIIVAFTYAGPRQSWAARFCNAGPIRWFGNISMSFYMSHMIILQEFNALGIDHWARTPLEPPGDTCPHSDLQLCMSGQFTGPSPDPDRWPSPQEYLPTAYSIHVHACSTARDESLYTTRTHSRDDIGYASWPLKFAYISIARKTAWQQTLTACAGVGTAMTAIWRGWQPA